MSQAAARLGDRVVAQDTHVVLVPTAGGPVPTPTVFPFAGTITAGCVPTVLIGGKPAAVVGSTAVNQPPHVPTNGSFQTPPTNLGTIVMGSATVLIGGRPAARNGDKVSTCNDPAPLPAGTIIATNTVLIG
jgi:uncharacterized Zn-binding protein involved in type VI secretion